MPKPRKSKAALILQFFNEEDLGIASTVLGLAQEIVKNRTPKSAAPAKSRAKKKSHEESSASAASQ